MPFKSKQLLDLCSYLPIEVLSQMIIPEAPVNQRLWKMCLNIYAQNMHEKCFGIFPKMKKNTQKHLLHRK